MAQETSKTGMWIDDESGKVVTKAPHRGTQLVRPGGRVTAAVQARIDSLDADPDAPAVSAAEVLGNDPDPTYEDVVDIVEAQPAKPAPAKKSTKK